MKKLVFLFQFCFIGVATTQHSLPVQMDTNLLNGEIITLGIFDYSGTSIENAMSSKLIYGGYIDEDTKNSSLNKHKIQNKYGLELNSEIEYRNYNLGNFLKGKYGFYIRGGYNAYASASYSDDLFGLVFYGNERYLSDTAYFSGTEANGIAFQKIGAGLIAKKMKSNLGINFYNISNYGDAFARTGYLYGDASAENFELGLDARLQVTNNKKFNQGWGVGFDGDFRFESQWIADRTAYFQAQFKNIGMMKINAIDQYMIDSTYNYNGLSFNQLVGQNELNTADESNLVDSLGVQRRTTSLTGFLPGFVQIGKIVSHNSNQIFQSFFGVRLYTTLVYNPLVFGGIEYKAYPWMRVGVQAIYGGFSNFRVGFYTQYSYKKLNFGIGSENLIGALSKKGNGESIHLRLALRW